MCSNCSGMFCYWCVKEWISNFKKECPHCWNVLTEQSLVKLWFMNEISDKLHKATGADKSKESCPTHSSPLDYYCETCKVTTCADCQIIDNAHQGHWIKKTVQIYN